MSAILSQPTAANNLQAALAVAASLPVFPCRNAPGKPRADKTPLTEHGFKDASRDPAQITAWWTANPDALIGVPTGDASHLFVVDDDTAKKPDAASTAWLATLPPTFTQVTRSGGKHHIYAQPAGMVTRSKVGIHVDGAKLASVDIRGDGGYIIMWCMHGFERKDDAYAPLPEALHKAVSAPVRSVAPEPLAPVSGGLQWNINRDALPGALAVLSPTGSEWWETGMALKDCGGDAAFPMWHEWSQRPDCGYVDEADCRKRWDSFGKNKDIKPRRIASVFKLARDRGWRPASELAQHTSQHPAAIAGRYGDVPAAPTGEPQAPPPPSGRFKIQSAEDYSKSQAYLRWRIKDVLPEQGVGTIFAPWGAGKTALALDMVGAIAKGWSCKKDDGQWFGHRVKGRKKVLYIVLEGQAGIKQRLDAYAKVYGWPHNLSVMVSPFNILDPEDVRQLCNQIAATEWHGAVLIIDTLSAAAQGFNENSPEDMGRALAGLQMLQRFTGGLVLAVHHTGKNVEAGLRGHSSLGGNTDVSLEIVYDPATQARAWKSDKERDSKTGGLHNFVLRPIVLGTDEDGDPISSIVIERDGVVSLDMVAAPKTRKLGTRQSLVLAEIKRQLAERKMLPGDGVEATRLPPGAKCVHEEVADSTGNHLMESKDTGKSAEWRRVIKSLVEARYLGTEHGWIWVI